jgi:hypothetical protein
MAQVKSYYQDVLELDRGPAPESIMSIDEQEDILYELFLDEINLLIEEAAMEDRQDLESIDQNT